MRQWWIKKEDKVEQPKQPETENRGREQVISQLEAVLGDLNIPASGVSLVTGKEEGKLISHITDGLSKASNAGEAQAFIVVKMPESLKDILWSEEALTERGEGGGLILNIENLVGALSKYSARFEDKEPLWTAVRLLSAAIGMLNRKQKAVEETVKYVAEGYEVVPDDDAGDFLVEEVEDNDVEEKSEEEENTEPER